MLLKGPKERTTQSAFETVPIRRHFLSFQTNVDRMFTEVLPWPFT